MNPFRFSKSGARRIASFLTLLLSLIIVPSVQAHDPGLSTGDVRLTKSSVEATLVFAVKDAGELANVLAGVEESWTAAGCAAVLARHATNAMEWVIDGRTVSPLRSSCTFDEAGNVTVTSVAPGAPSDSLRIRSVWLANLPLGHRQFMVVRRSDGAKVAERMLSAGEDAFTLGRTDLHPAADNSLGRADDTGRRFIEFLLLGLKHILIGYDHLLFLFTLLIVNRTLLDTFKVISTFTIAHSMTLALATLNVVPIPGSLVEPLIAASIVFVAMENLFRRESPPGRLWLVFAFGLIHGLGFASVLSELGVGRGGSGIVVPLLSFNLGVELGQLLVALPSVGVLAWVARQPMLERRYVPACSVMAAMAGGFWLVERLMG